MTTDDPISPDEVILSGDKYKVLVYLESLLQVEDDSPGEEHSSKFALDDEEPAYKLRDLEHGVAESRRARHSRGVDAHDVERSERVGPPTRDGSSDVDWTISLSDRFAKSALRLDRKLQGRLLEALMEICNAPDSPHGDTIKPLDGDRRGEWRYRIGDYRVIYRPIRDRREVLLLEVAHRGGVYG